MPAIPALLAAFLALPAHPAQAPRSDLATRGMGPLSASLALARKQWKEDACFAGLGYGWRPLDRRGPEGGGEALDRLESYSYAFFSPGEPKVNFVVVRADAEDGAGAVERDALRTERWPLKQQHSRCITEVSADLDMALRAAYRQGLSLWDRRAVDAGLVALPAEFRPEDLCEVPGSRGLYSRPCSLLTAVEAGRRAKLAGREFWVVSNDQGSVYLTADKGRFLLRVLQRD